MSKPLVKDVMRVATTCVCGCGCRYRAKESGRKAEGRWLGAGSRATPLGVLTSACGASVGIWAALSSKTPTLVIVHITLLLLLARASSRRVSARGGRGLGVSGVAGPCRVPLALRTCSIEL